MAILWIMVGSLIGVVIMSLIQINCDERLLIENKQWETNYNNLSAEFEEVSAIAQAQAKEIEELKGGK